MPKCPKCQHQFDSQPDHPTCPYCETPSAPNSTIASKQASAASTIDLWPDYPYLATLRKFNNWVAFFYYWLGTLAVIGFVIYGFNIAEDQDIVLIKFLVAGPIIWIFFVRFPALTCLFVFHLLTPRRSKDLPDNTQKVYDELLKAVLPSEMFQGDKLMTKDGQEWEAPQNANFNWRGILYRLLGGSGGAYFPNFTKDLDAFISRQGLSSDTKHKSSRSLSDAGSNKKRWLAVFDPSRDDTIAHEGWHDVQSYLLQNYPDISSKLETAVLNREAEISDFINNTKGLGYSAGDVFASEHPLEDDKNIKQLLSSQMRGESVPMMLQSYKSSKNKQAQDLLSEIFAEAGLNPEFYKHF